MIWWFVGLFVFSCIYAADFYWLVIIQYGARDVIAAGQLSTCVFKNMFRPNNEHNLSFFFPFQIRIDIKEKSIVQVDIFIYQLCVSCASWIDRIPSIGAWRHTTHCTVKWDSIWRHRFIRSFLTLFLCVFVAIFLNNFFFYMQQQCCWSDNQKI